MPRDAAPWGRWIGLGLAALVVTAVVLVIRGGSQVPDEPVPVAWDQQTCAHCRMAVGQPGFAAELVTAEGDLYIFDDPGCLLRYLDERAPRVHRMWFHHPTEERWLDEAQVGFRVTDASPMGWGLAAAERAPGTLDLAAARAHVAQRAATPDAGGAR